jgi:hypothetical protein
MSIPSTGRYAGEPNPKNDVARWSAEMHASGGTRKVRAVDHQQRSNDERHAPLFRVVVEKAPDTKPCSEHDRDRDEAQMNRFQGKYRHSNHPGMMREHW